MQQQSSAPTSIRSTVHLLADEGSMPAIAAHVEHIMGRPVVFVTMSTDHRTSSYQTRDRGVVLGFPEAVKDLLTRCLATLEDLTGGEPDDAA